MGKRDPDADPDQEDPADDHEAGDEDVRGMKTPPETPPRGDCSQVSPSAGASRWCSFKFRVCVSWVGLCGRDRYSSGVNQPRSALISVSSLVIVHESN